MIMVMLYVHIIYAIYSFLIIHKFLLTFFPVFLYFFILSFWRSMALCHHAMPYSRIQFDFKPFLKPNDVKRFLKVTVLHLPYSFAFGFSVMKKTMKLLDGWNIAVSSIAANLQ